MKTFTKIIREKEGAGRLGRHVEHDPRSRAYQAGTGAIKTVTYKRHGKPFDQGDLGSCTGNAMAGVLMTDPFWVTGRNLGETDAVALYKAATRLDNIKGQYPPEDTGSSGIGVMKAAVKAKYITGYAHTFSLAQLLGSLSLRPGILGINWYDSFDDPRPDGECRLTAGARIRGGHEVQLFGLDASKKRVWCYNSWGPTWGGRRNGTFYLAWKTLDRLLHEQGDATFPRVT
ncbi:MAG TPA: hypothetical protein VMQ73_11005 [Methylomirabilota bacterium]|nr:hypothetical protein [Methylomirabilota bacterium]